ncbi:MAG: 50S ribosomal protein L40e [Candidatus Aenigmarchaeota archaeon ex4484_52]|nr:MAG: 50S ribosomal protein L40e [Candidatus Aenigmarchaeota archaeon ex4484_52]
MVKIRDADAEARMYKNVFVCMKCNAKTKGKTKLNLKCRKCGAKAMRLAKKAVKKA